MASDTATLDLERVHEERRRLEEARDEGRLEPITLGPDDRAPAGAGSVDTDPATRAHLIVQEVLAAAAHHREGEADAAATLDPGVDGPAAVRARRIVQEVLAAAGHSADAQTVTADEEGTADDPTITTVRADLVILGVPQPMVRIPGPLYLPTPGAFRPEPERSWDRLLSRALAPATEPDGSAADADADAAPQTLRAAISGAAETTTMPRMRWIVAGAVWAVAFALVVPLMVRGVFSSVDLTVDLFSPTSDTGTEVQQPIDQPVDQPAATDTTTATN